MRRVSLLLSVTSARRCSEWRLFIHFKRQSSNASNSHIDQKADTISRGETLLSRLDIVKDIPQFERWIRHFRHEILSQQEVTPSAAAHIWKTYLYLLREKGGNEEERDNESALSLTNELGKTFITSQAGSLSPTDILQLMEKVDGIPQKHAQTLWNSFSFLLSSTDFAETLNFDQLVLVLDLASRTLGRDKRTRDKYLEIYERLESVLHKRKSELKFTPEAVTKFLSICVGHQLFFPATAELFFDTIVSEVQRMELAAALRSMVAFLLIMENSFILENEAKFRQILDHINQTIDKLPLSERALLSKGVSFDYTWTNARFTEVLSEKSLLSRILRAFKPSKP